MADGQPFDMSNLSISSSTSNYDVIFSSSLSFNDSNTFVLVDENLFNYVTEQKLDISHVIKVPGSEKTKTLEKAAWLFAEMAQRGLTKQSRLVAIGGGSVQDLATLASALYMRGIDWVFVPTTLMAMMDSCIGGKSAINVGTYKNIVGNFYPPKEIIIDLEVLKNLPQSGFTSGMCEAVKIQIAKSRQNFESFISDFQDYQLTKKTESLEKLVFSTLLSKKWFVEIDEYDQKERKLLNYGHSFGHALESATGMQILHGIAIGIGMLVANAITERTDYHAQIDKFVYGLIQESGFDFENLKFNSEVFTKSLLRDKKNSPTHQNLILLSNLGNLEVVSITKSDENLKHQTQMMIHVLNNLGVRA